MTAQEIAVALGPHSVKSGGGFMACCPAHDDKIPSLSIDESNGSLLFKCFAGCDQDAVVDALKLQNLWPNCNALTPTRKAVSAPKWEPVLPVPNDAPGPPEIHYKYDRPSHIWRYLSSNGDLLHMVYRFDTSDGKKQVLPLTYCTNGVRKEWRFQAVPDNRPLYGLDVIGDTSHILIVEGEKATDAARRLLGKNLPVVTWSGGSNAVAKADLSPLKTKNIAIWPDADATGIKAAIDIADTLVALGSTVKIVQPPDNVPKGWDLADAELENWNCDQLRTFLKAALPVDNYKAWYCQTHTEEKIRGYSDSLQVVELHDFLRMKFPPRECLLSPWLPAQGLAMVYAPRGVGKTHFSLGVAYSISSGGSFLQWTADKPRSVLFIDGEMPGNVLQERICNIAISHEKEPAAPLRIVTPDLQHDGMLNLSDPAEHALIEKHLEGIDLIIVDNLSTLCRSGKEAESESWLPIQSWALKQRALGRSVLFIHHAGKNGEQRGTSRREDVLDTVIALRRPGDYTPDQGACFEVHFEKARGLYGEDTKPFEAKLSTDQEGQQTWVMKPLDQSTAEKVASLLNEGIPQTQIAEMLGITKGAVSKAKKRAEVDGLLQVS